MKLLLVEDEMALLQNLKQRLSDLGCLVDGVENGEQGLVALEQTQYDLVILDLGLPKCSGLEVLQSVRQDGLNKNTPILILSARNSWKERVEGLNHGADDYLGKPFEFDELWARLLALYRRHQPQHFADDYLEIDALRLNLHNKSLELQGEVISLTKTEYRLLHYFMSYPNHVLSKEKLIDRITDHSSERDSNVIEVYIRKLRQKIGRHRIETLRGLGYRLIGDGS